MEPRELWIEPELFETSEALDVLWDESQYSDWTDEDQAELDKWLDENLPRVRDY